jgi:hypothetical protein
MTHAEQDRAGKAAASAPPPPEEPPASWPKWDAWLPADLPWHAIGAGAAAGVLAALILIAASRFTGGDGGVSAVEARLARVEQQLGELSGRPPPPAVDPKTVDELTSRLAKLEAAVTGLRTPAPNPELLNRISTLEGALKALDEKLGIVARRTDDISVIARDAREKADANAKAVAELAQKVAQLGTVSPGDLDALSNRIGALERGAKTVEGELARRGIGEAGDRAVRLAVTAAALGAAVERGDPFATELATAKLLAADPRALAPLEPFATTGVPLAASLARELAALVPALTQAAGGVPRDAGVLARLAAGAERLVRIRPLDEATGDDPAAVLARIELKAAQADLAGALAELAKLPANVQAPAQPWIAKAQARIAAVAASRRFAAEAFAAIGKTP